MSTIIITYTKTTQYSISRKRRLTQTLSRSWNWKILLHGPRTYCVVFLSPGLLSKFPLHIRSGLNNRTDIRIVTSPSSYQLVYSILQRRWYTCCLKEGSREIFWERTDIRRRKYFFHFLLSKEISLSLSLSLNDNSKSRFKLCTQKN